MEDKGLRFNEGKDRTDLVAPYAQSQYVKVLTYGSKKYAERNWEKGMKWSKVIASLKRHLHAIEMGKDYDEETGLLHSAHVMTNAAFLTEYYKIHPQGDDRPHAYLNKRRIGLDIDNVLADFCGAYKEVHGGEIPVYWKYDRQMKRRLEELPEEFWLNIKPLIDPLQLPFEPVCYITSRPCTNSLSEQWIDKMGFPTAPVFTVDKKLETIKANRLDVFVDDSYDTFVDLNANGVLCYLFSAPHNERYQVGHKRIKTLKDLI